MSLKKTSAAIFAASSLLFSFPSLNQKAQDFDMYSYNEEKVINFNETCAGKVVCLISGSFC